jgi:hypothetical protein
MLNINIARDKSKLIGIVPNHAWTIGEDEWKNYVDLGVKSVRIEFILSPAGGNPDALDFSAYDKVIDKANELGIEVMMLVAYGSFVSKRHDLPVSWGKVLKYDNYMDLVPALEKIVPHFRDKGVHAWEIWNEENGLWHLDPEEYAELLTCIYEKFKYTDKWDEEAAIIYGGLDAVNAPPNPMGINTGSAQWFKDSYESKFFKDFRKKYGHPPLDAVSVHPYHVVKVTDDGEVEYNYILPALKGLVIDTMDNAGDTKIPVWITEVGSHDKNEIKQAKILEEFFKTAISEPRITRLHWFKYEYTAKDGKNSGTSGYGIVYSDHEKKASYRIMKKLANDYNALMKQI